jgi:hypothetical protein
MELERMKVTELKELARKKGCKKYSLLRKAELIEYLKNNCKGKVLLPLHNGIELPFHEGVRTISKIPLTKKICKTLLESNYNATLLSGASNEVQDLFKTVSSVIVKKTQQKTKVNLPLAICVNNYYTKKPIIVPRISGVGSIIRLDGMGKIIYLFSDETHSYDYSCKTTGALGMDVDKYFEKLMDTSDKFIDIYAETDKFYRRISPSYLSQVADIFLRCRGGDNIPSYCPKNGRYHYIDIRDAPDLNPLQDINRFDKAFKSVADAHLYVKSAQYYLDIVNGDFSTYKKWALKIAKKHPLVEKELSKLSPDFRENITNVLLDIEWYQLQDGRDFINSTFQNLIIDPTIIPRQYLWFAISYGYIFLMDLYFIARLFKGHNVTKSYDPPYAKYIIVYAGSSHTIVYNKFFQKMGFKLVEKVYWNDAKSCVDMSKIRQPLFSDL